MGRRTHLVFSSRGRHTRFDCDWSSAVCSSDLTGYAQAFLRQLETIFPGITAKWIGKATLSAPFRDPLLNCSYSYWKPGQYRSEERRVGKECRSRWSPYH